VFCGSTDQCYYVVPSGVDPYRTEGRVPQYLLSRGDMPMNVLQYLGVLVLETSIFSRHLIARSPSVCSNKQRLTAAAVYFLSEDRFQNNLLYVCDRLMKSN